MPKRTERIKSLAFREVFGNPPSRVKQTKRTRGPVPAKKQQIAIALSKARQMGARIPRRNST